ncbi:MAG TPA: YqgE/AlgH family protein [Bryobacteraceae bacterium]
MRRSVVLLAAAAAVLFPACRAAAADLELQQFAQKAPPSGSLLVATEKLGDPAFAKSVILIVDSDDQGTVGLMINRQTTVPISRIFKRKRAGSDPVYIGGPVELRSVQALLRSSVRVSDATRVVGSVYDTADRDAIEKGIDSRAGPSKFRLYLGYAGWGPGQLQHEISLGAWSMMAASAAIVFDSHPDSLWTRLNARLHMQIVKNVRHKTSEISMVR